MLQSTMLLKKGAQENKNGLDKLGIKTQQSLESLESIQKLLNSRSVSNNTQQIETHNQECIRKLEEQYDHVKSESQVKNDTLLEKSQLLEQTQHQVHELRQSLESLSIKYDIDMDNWHRKYTASEEELLVLKEDYDELSKKNQDLEDMVNQLEELHEREVQRKEQLELMLRESTQEQKITTQGVLERDQKIEEYQQNLSYMQQMMDEKDELLEGYMNKTQIDPEEYQKLQIKIGKLEEENHRCKRRLNNLNELYHHKEEEQQQQEEQLDTDLSYNNEEEEEEEEEEINNNATQSEQWIQTDDENNNSNISVNKASNTNKSNTSRIPVPTYRSTQQHDLTDELNMMKEDLLLYQEKLVEKISQNRELESAMERVNEHCQILRTSLNETREESADRYRKMMQYMEENRILKEQLNNRRNYRS